MLQDMTLASPENDGDEETIADEKSDGECSTSESDASECDGEVIDSVVSHEYVPYTGIATILLVICSSLAPTVGSVWDFTQSDNNKVIDICLCCAAPSTRCIRAMVISSETLTLGSLYVVTCNGLTIGREVTGANVLCIPDELASRVNKLICFPSVETFSLLELKFTYVYK